MRRNTFASGAILILIGLLLLVARYAFGVELLNLQSYDFWVFIVLGVGLTFEFLFFATGRNPGFLVPGGIISTIGFLFLFEAATDWRFSMYTWPVYILSVAIGLFQLYLFSGRNKGLLIPVGILSGIALTAFAAMLFGSLASILDLGLIGPVVIILLGVLIIFGTNKKDREFK